ncbi:CYTH domain-containing protein [Paracoccus liaowanqingii]|uniref:CYTH domain-containing protein n=1 Tax=Paracoccus liaowanqingii TaxID=2560053 RepID=A0A4P7HIA5_9RHOB|nr:CYTH domain-containing protein [Paracoccus liaowanqingii]QBX33383.1 CYTH domain-containing protein [Paracoccus liaowanqingii]
MATPQEIERKFLVPALPDLSAARPSALRQGYVTLPQDSVEVRLRQSDDTHVLCLKSGEGIVRTEREITIEAAQFDLLWPQTEGRRIEKTRWTGRLDDGHTFELDVFDGDLAPLVTVEVEFGSEAEATAFAPPAWFGRDVSADGRFRNKSLALSGATLIRELFA